MPSTDRQSCPPSPNKKDLTVCTPFTLSLIRRDPGTSSQWNVGKISSYQIESTQPQSQEADHLSVYSSIFPEPMPMQHPPISIQIETSGYARFRNNPVRESIDLIGHHASAAQIRASFDSGAFSRREAGMYFSRQVSMAYSKSWSSNLKEKFQQASRKISHARSESQASTGSEHTVESATTSPEAPSLDRLKARGYTFQSPWDKRCEFRTGHGGRSVQCRHVLNDSQAVTYNPLVAEAPKPSSVIVSELRFNLPAADFFPPSEAQRDSMQSYRLGHFGKFLKSAAGTDREDETDQGLVSPFDLNIGSEKAGGGPHGSRAKLGKLIIYHDGLKMLDLIVAANMGLWWGAWEKSF
ncbi:hypothetical protein ESCO_002322 [Escovopsis weberi]|uniref:Uncharacterized protein n=1 Tax=Escovopsis weberi TaxID=150374 RepID=A0A0M8MZI6_ESCWE|nr:hypothetical protein ESCO_002322 [Escovopsis weberi]